MNSHSLQLASGWHVYGRNQNLQTPFDTAVVMPTVGRDSIVDAVASVYAQEGVGRIQLLIGVDAPRGDFTRLQELLEAAPDHVTPCLFYPGFSTSVRHGGLHPARDGGALRTTLSYLANARYIAYLDDDNWWGPSHVRLLLAAIQGRDWAFATRWFVHPDSRQPVCLDDWESVGPGRGEFAKKFGGWVDPNCLMLDKLACEPALRWWCIPLPGDNNAMSADRHVYDWLQRKSAPGESPAASVFYAMQPEDDIHPFRLKHMGLRYAAASQPVKPDVARLTAITTCKGRLHHLKQTLPLLVKQANTDVVVVDYGCPQGTAAWVKQHYPSVKVIEVLDDAGFNCCRARNIGAKAALTPWLLFIDADVMVNEGFENWMNPGLNPKEFYLTSAYGSELTGSMFCSRSAFEKMGGYDEALRGWGGEDEDLYHRMAAGGQQRQTYPDGLLTAIHHGDDERFVFFKESNREEQHIVNHLYLCMKYDLMAVWGRDLSLAERNSLNTLAAGATQKIVKDDKLNAVEVFLELNEQAGLTRFTAWGVARRLVYQFFDRKMVNAINGMTPDA
ncbi:MAG: glycosyltransferase [Pseudomonadota bacterium]